MTAFNKRFQPFEIFGMPGVGAFGTVFAFFGGLMASLMPTPISVVFGVLGAVSLIAAVLAFALGDDFRWLFQKWLSLLERRTSSQFGRNE